jgi:hypothetical protein
VRAKHPLRGSKQEGEYFTFTVVSFST